MKSWLLDVNNWSKLPGRYGQNEEALYRNKRNILFSQITLLATLVGILHALESLFDHNGVLSLLDFIMTAVVFSAYQINESGRHFAAKLFLLSFLNIYFFLYSLVTPRELGMYVFYFPWVAVASLVFEYEQRFWRIFFVVLSVSLIITLFITDFELLASWRMNIALPGRTFVFNVIVSVLLTTVFIHFMVLINEDSEERLRNVTAEVRQKNAQLQSTNEQLDRFVYSASHNIKLPVIAIKGLTHVASVDFPDPRAREYFKKIEDQTDKLGMFLLEMLEYTRNDRTALRLERVNITALVDEVINGLSHLDNAKKIEFRKFIRIDGVLSLDRVRFMVILNNLLSNAIRYHNYTHPNPWVKIMISKMDNNIQVMIADNGFGIHDDYKDKVFDMFFHHSASPIGAGLGLFIVKETVEKMNGKIMLSSTEGEGACFRIDLPLVA